MKKAKLKKRRTVGASKHEVDALRKKGGASMHEERTMRKKSEWGDLVVKE